MNSMEIRRKRREPNPLADEIRSELQRIEFDLVEDAGPFHQWVTREITELTPVCPIVAQRDRSTPHPLTGESLKLLQIMDIGHLNSLDELECTLSSLPSKRYCYPTQAQGQQLLESTRFRGWISSETSDLLLVNGNEDGKFDPCYKVSSLAFLSAHLYLSVARKTNFIVLYYLCSETFSRKESHYLGEPQGLVRGFIVQLLSTGYPFKYTFMTHTSYIEWTKTKDISKLCWIFKQLLVQLPREQGVFCMVDNIGCFDPKKWGNDLEIIMSMFTLITRDHQPSLPMVKALFTNIAAGTEIERELRRLESVVSLRAIEVALSDADVSRMVHQSKSDYFNTVLN